MAPHLVSESAPEPRSILLSIAQPLSEALQFFPVVRCRHNGGLRLPQDGGQLQPCLQLLLPGSHMQAVLNLFRARHGISSTNQCTCKNCRRHCHQSMRNCAETCGALCIANPKGDRLFKAPDEGVGKPLSKRAHLLSSSCNLVINAPAHSASAGDVHPCLLGRIIGALLSCCGVTKVDGNAW